MAGPGISGHVRGHCGNDAAICGVDVSGVESSEIAKMMQMSRIFRVVLLALFGPIFFISGALSQGAIQQSGPVTPGHVGTWYQNGIQGDSGPASGTPGPGISEILGVVRGSGTPPYANAGSGPLGTNWCDYDAPATNSTGRHYLCFSPNALGGGLIAYGALGGASSLPLNCIVNGVSTPCAGGSVTMPVALLTSYGGACDGVTNNTSAIETAAAALGGGGWLQLPAGTCLMNAVISGNNIAIFGVSGGTIIKPYAAGNALEFTNSNFASVNNLSILGGSFGAGSGLVFGAGTFNSKAININVAGFPAYQIACEGSSGGGQLSGNGIYDSIILSPASTTAGAYWDYCNDFHIIDNQMGAQSGVSYSTGTGLDIENSSAGQATGNFIWQNNIGLINNAGNYNWITENRITQSWEQGLIAQNSAELTDSNNQLYQNSNASDGEYESEKLVGVSKGTLTNNRFFDWTGVAHVNYHLTVDSTSSVLDIENNYFDPATATVEPTNVSSSASGVIFQNNTPIQNAYTNDCSKPLTWLSGGISTSVGGSGATIYLGSAGEASSNYNTYWLSGGNGTVCSFQLLAGTAPGSGQMETVTVEHQGTPTSLTATLSGATQTLTEVSPSTAFAVNQNDTIDLKVVGSSGAASSSYQYTIGIAQ